ncbi:MAG: hypothetical protein WC179_09725 [Candidatus Cloacimonadaceae bacterium]
MEQKILNLTQHVATPEQIEAGVFEPIYYKSEIQALLTFEEIPSKMEMEARARRIMTFTHTEAQIQKTSCTKVMIGGAPYFMSYLENTFRENGVFTPVYAFSKRESIDQQQPDGSVRKVQVFRHAGFVDV